MISEYGNINSVVIIYFVSQDYRIIFELEKDELVKYWFGSFLDCEKGKRVGLQRTGDEELL